MKLQNIDFFLNQPDMGVDLDATFLHFFQDVNVIAVVAPRSSGKTYVGSYLARRYTKYCHVVTLDMLMYETILPPEQITSPNERVPHDKTLLIYDCEHYDLPKFLPECKTFVFMVRHAVQIPDTWRDKIDVMVVPRRSRL